MKLSEIKTPNVPGTYVALRVVSPSFDQLNRYCVENNIPLQKGIYEDRYHVTVLYSKNHCPDIKKNSFVHIARFSGFEIFGDKKEKYLVATLEAPTVVDRHNYFMQEHGGHHSHPSFNPHITLSDSFSGNIKDLPPLNFPVVLAFEYIEDLDIER